MKQGVYDKSSIGDFPSDPWEETDTLRLTTLYIRKASVPNTFIFFFYSQRGMVQLT